MYACKAGLRRVSHRLTLLDFAENEIDGQAFSELTEDDVRRMTEKLGIVKKICRLKVVMCCILFLYAFVVFLNFFCTF